jgi:hypothetical protein
MKKILIFCLFLFVANHFLFSQETPKNIIGISAGIVPGTMDMYFDMPFNFWPNREQSPIYQIFYARQLLEYFRIGAYVEYEKVNFSDNESSEIHNFKRSNIGINWLGQYPKTPFHAQLGGYYGYGSIKSGGWDNLTGTDYGIMVGPAYEKGKMGVALHAQLGHAWYKSDGTPIGVMLYTPKYLLKVYYKF